MATQPNNKYDSSQAELYAICYLGWNICKEHQVDVMAVYPEYTMLYVDGKINNIKSAEELPDFQARDLTTETAHIILKQLSDVAVGKWRLLERYITRAFQTNKPLIKPNIEAAGKQYLEKASRDNPNWEDVKRLLVDGNKYLNDNAAVLAPFMPVAFPGQYTTDKTNFEAQYLLFTTKEFEAPEGTYAKISANNAIYDDLLLMLGDIKEIAPIPAASELSFAYLKGIISAPGPAGLKGTITADATGSKPAGVLLRLLETEYEATTNGAGEYDFGNIASGKYTLEISKTGYQTLTVEVTIFTGVTSTKNFTITPNP